MQFRPCIDIHNGKVKQIVGGSLIDHGDKAEENYASPYMADYYASLYKRDGLKGGHVILLNPPSSEYYSKTREQAYRALSAYPQGLQLGGGITAENASEYLDRGASHVIVTSYVFQNGQVHRGHMVRLCSEVGKEHVVLDLSCRKKDGLCYIVTDRWQKFTEITLSKELLNEFSRYCDEFLVHGVDVEGKASGVDETLAEILEDYAKTPGAVPVTYAGGIGSYEDIERFRKLTHERIDFTIGSALDLFGGKLSYDKVKTL